MTPRRHLIAGLAASAALLVLPASAMAGTKTVSGTLSALGQNGTIAAKCTGKQKATGGGFTVSAPGGGVVVYESRKIGQKTWQVSAKARFSPGTFTAYAYCSNKGVKTKESVGRVLAPGLGSPFVNADAKCSSGKVQAGGFLLDPIYAIQTSSFASDKTTWRVTAKNAGGPDLTYASYAYCAKRPKVKTKSGNASSNVDFALLTATSSKCKKHTKALSGGFSQVITNSGHYVSPITQSLKSGKTWTSTGVNTTAGSGATNTLTTYAYCG